MNRNSKRNEDMEPEKEMRADVVIVGTGAAGLFAALNLPGDRKVLIITKKDAESSDSFLAQGGSVCSKMSRTMRAISKIRCGQGIMRTEKNLWTS